MSTAVKRKEVSEFDTQGRMKALDEHFAIIEFETDGTIITANKNFLGAVGYSLSELQGNHHRIFCESEYASSLEYKQFWASLAKGEVHKGEFERFTKEGHSFWLSASYTPIEDSNGKVYKVIKFAQDNTDNVLRNADYRGKIEAIERSQAVIEFNLDGTIIKANDNFLGAMGYSLSDVQGKHHRIFCEESYVKTPEYAALWQKLGAGQFVSGEFKRLDKSGNEVWINASYNPIYNANGKVMKVVKFATDVTEEKLKNAEFENKMNAVNRSQAVIEFNLDGTIIDANDNFLVTLGYTLEEVRNQHHRIFCESSYTNSADYKSFWEKLNRGEFVSGEFKRLGKGGKEVWINASYNPIFNVDGEVYKVVKFATDLTKEKESYNNLVSTFERAADELAASAEQLNANAEKLSHNSQSTSNQSEGASAAVEQLGAGINSVDKSTEEMVMTIKEISASALNASQMSDQAKTKSEETNKLISELQVSSEEIGGVIKLISSIAQQTNLLALNATIEAARAGEAGKGFAVVANEVKELAKQTASATNEISERIEGIQGSTGSSVKAVEEIVGMIESLNSLATSTSSSVEEQAATMEDVSRVVQESGISVKNVAEVIQQVSDSSNENARGSKETQDAAIRLKEMSSELKRLVLEAKVS